MTGRGLRGRQIARAMLVVPIVFAGLIVFLLIASPHTMGGDGDYSPLRSWIGWVGITWFAIGAIWMIRIYRAAVDPEANASRFRFRR